MMHFSATEDFTVRAMYSFMNDHICSIGFRSGKLGLTFHAVQDFHARDTDLSCTCTRAKWIRAPSSMNKYCSSPNVWRINGKMTVLGRGCITSCSLSTENTKHSGSHVRNTPVTQRISKKRRKRGVTEVQTVMRLKVWPTENHVFN